jgi:hypothetical protein
MHLKYRGIEYQKYSDRLDTEEKVYTGVYRGNRWIKSRSSARRVCDRMIVLIYRGSPYPIAN